MTVDTFYTDTGLYVYMNWTTSTSYDAGQYFQAKITPDASKQITYNKVAFTVAADNYPGGSPEYFGPTTIDLRYSTDDFASSNVLIQTLTWTPTGTFQQVPFDVDISSIGTRSGPITFRWYGYKRNAAGDSTSSMGFSNWKSGPNGGRHSGTGSNIIFKGTVSSTNTAPTDIRLSANSINENVAANSTVGTLSSTDPDAGNTFTYTLVTGTGSTDNASFNISGSSLRITSSPDFETKSSYSVRVRTTDQGSLTYEKAFTITINNLNEAPTDIALSAGSINENVAANSTVGSLSSTDPDAGNTFTYTLVTGTGSTDNASFNISGSSLRITSSPDFETKSSYSVRVRTTDQGGLTYEKAFTITINDLNEAPTDITLSASSINENVAANSTVGTLSSTDPDAGNTFTYTLVTGTGSTDNASFNISGSSLRITSSPDFETKSSYSVRVRTTDQGGLTYEKAFTITINNLNEAPTDITLIGQLDQRERGGQLHGGHLEFNRSGCRQYLYLYPRSPEPGLPTTPPSI